MTDRIGQQLGNYRLTRLLGRGGFAEVYLGQHIRLNLQAAIKVLHTQLADDDIENFHREAQTIASLIHPHIVRILDFDLKDGVPFLVIDYAPNGSLRRQHRKGSVLPLPTIISYVRQVAAALQYAHEQKLIHRDVKPENMLLGRHSEVLLSDFGIAIITQSSHYQDTQDMAGTIAYMAPEQIQAHPRPASDQYALGIVVYEWLCGARPFTGSFTEIAVKHAMTPPPSLRQRLPTIPTEVEQVVLTALAKDPGQRFASVQAFATALEQASRMAAPQQGTHTLPQSVPSQPLIPESRLSSQLQVPPTLAAGPAETSWQRVRPPEGATHWTSPDQSHAQPVQRVQRELSRRRMVLGLVGLTLVAGTVSWFALSHSPSLSSLIPTPKPVIRTPTPIPLGTRLYTYRGHSDGVWSAAWSPDGRRIASGSWDKTAQVWDASDGSQAFTYRGHSNRVWSVAWSPDGRHIASGSQDHTVQVWDASTGATLFTYRGHSNGVNAVAWSADGGRIASGAGDSGKGDYTVQVWDASTGATLFTYRSHSDIVWAIAWSPDGRRIASGSADKTVQVWDAVGGDSVATDGSQAFTYRGHSNWVNAVAWSPDGRRIASGSADQTVQVWDTVGGDSVVTDGSQAFTYRGHSNWVNAVAWSPDGRHIASGSADKTVQVWNATDGSQAYTYRGHSGAVSAVSWSPDGRRIASGSLDKTVQVWDAG